MGDVFIGEWEIFGAGFPSLYMIFHKRQLHYRWS